MGLTKGQELEKEDAFKNRERLTNILHDLSNEYDEKCLELKKKYLPDLNRLTDSISILRSKLYELGVPVEDC